MDVNSNENLVKDINDVFDAIAFSENQICSRAFQEGLIKGKEDGTLEGYHLGFHRGFELGCEIGFYKGLTKVLINNFSKIKVKKKEKIHSLLINLMELLNNFPNHNSDEVDLLKNINEIRSNYKKLNSILKLNLSFPVSPKLSF